MDRRAKLPIGRVDNSSQPRSRGLPDGEADALARFGPAELLPILVELPLKVAPHKLSGGVPCEYPSLSTTLLTYQSVCGFLSRRLSTGCELAVSPVHSIISDTGSFANVSSSG